MNAFQRIAHHPFFIKLFHWEYWSFNSIYMPVMIVWVWLSLRARSFFFFAAANPSIANGGFLMESKKAIYDILPPSCYPKTIYATKGIDPGEISPQLTKAGILYPLICKPDIGGKGKGVKKVHNLEELADYCKSSRVDFLVQEYIPFEKEAGIFYYRYPGKEKGSVSGVVTKEFLTVTGDGKSTLKEICEKEKRFVLQLNELQRMYGDRMNEVLEKGVSKELVPYGNHSRGAKFIDDSHLIDHELTDTMDRVCQQVKDFYYGRLDIRFNTWEELKQGKNFSIIELNGAGSEPTHMYDPRHSLFFAWKEIIRHWMILWRISRLNHKKQIPYLTSSEGLKMLTANKKMEKIMAEQNV